MKRIILLRFHNSPEIIQNRIDILKKINPEIPIYGLFGGKKEEFENFKNLKDLEELTFLNIENETLKWRCSDLGILQWYKDFGSGIDFDIVHTIEWDLILLEKLEKLYTYNEGEKHIYLTSPIVLDKVIKTWFWFIHPDFPTQESKDFIQHVTEKYGIKQHYASQGPGTTLTREFLEGYSKLDLPRIAHDELRLPAIAQILGIEFRNTNFGPKDWDDESSRTYQLFNCDKREVTSDVLIEAYNAGEKKTFHPVYELIDLRKL